MITNKFIKSLLLNLAVVGLLFGFGIENSNAYPVFAQQNYSIPRAANGKLGVELANNNLPDPPPRNCPAVAHPAIYSQHAFAPAMPAGVRAMPPADQ